MSRVTSTLDHAGERDPAPVRRGGMVATSQPLAVEAGLDVMRRGGNAIDAAVCAAAVLCVVEPMSTGIGGDCFALAWRPGDQAPVGINGSGRAPVLADIADLRRRGHDEMPERGVLSVTVPGGLHAWKSLLDARGTMRLADLLKPAIRYADEGFEVTPAIADGWASLAQDLREGDGTQIWLVDGRAPEAGERFRCPDLGHTLAHVAADGIGTFYGGRVAQAIEEHVRRVGGWLTARDLEAHESTWVTPLEVSYRGHSVFELPPNGQGIVVLEALGILGGYPLADVREDHRWHLMIEAIKLAFADGLRYVGDPDHLEAPPQALLDEAYLERRREAIGDHALQAATAGLPGTDTVYVAAVDPDGGCCSLINSLYMPFGSMVVAEGTGVTLQNRGALFSLEKGHPNALGPRRRPYHTIIPAMVFREGRPWIVLGVVGGFQQPQGQVQILSRMIDLGAEPEEAVAAPRFRWVEGADVRIEHGAPAELAEDLAGRGHRIVERDGYGGFGGAQVIRIDPATGALAGAADPRRDGRAGSL